jgi:hypothetical protein
MAITYTWSFGQFDTIPNKNGLTDVVAVIHWKLTATDGVHSASNYGSVRLADPTSSTFVPYASITKALATQWVTGLIDLAATQADLTRQLNSMSTPTVTPKTPPFGS